MPKRGRRQQMAHTGEPTPEQRAWLDRHERRERRRATIRCNMLQFWRICAKRACVRHRTCSDDPHACFARHWVMVPEDEKVWLRAGVRARAEGLTPERAARAADADVARHRALTEKLAAPAPAAIATAGSAPSHPPRPEAPAVSPAPRLRHL